jgi:hypothetical protein
LQFVRQKNIHGHNFIEEYGVDAENGLPWTKLYSAVSWDDVLGWVRGTVSIKLILANPHKDEF